MKDNKQPKQLLNAWPRCMQTENRGKENHGCLGAGKSQRQRTIKNMDWGEHTREPTYTIATSPIYPPTREPTYTIATSPIYPPTRQRTHAPAPTTDLLLSLEVTGPALCPLEQEKQVHAMAGPSIAARQRTVIV
jgi:hypothetical protein